MKDIISDQDAKAIRQESAQRIADITRGYNPEALAAQFSALQTGKKKSFADLAHERKTQGHVDGTYEPYTPPTLPTISYLEAKQAFWKIYSSVVGTTPILTENNKLQLADIVAWLIFEGNIPKDKGIYLFGDYGRGKTDLIKAMYLFSIKAKNHYSNVRELSLAKEYKFMYEKARKNLPIKGLYMNEKPCTIDDIGFKEETQLKLFGNTQDLVSDIIYARHSIWMKDRANHSIFTSNLFPDDILTAQGEGVYSRLLQMCHVVYWDGLNFRIPCD